MAHEDLSREQIAEGSSDRAFGWVFAAVFLIIAGWPLLSAESPRWWAAAIAVAFAAVAQLRPALLAVPNRWWMKLGLLLGRIVAPIALGVLYYGALTPIGALMRLTGKDPMRQKLEREAPSYWMPRTPPGPPPDSINNQF
jgi:hypothetical protein